VKIEKDKRMLGRESEHEKQRKRGKLDEEGWVELGSGEIYSGLYCIVDCRGVGNASGQYVLLLTPP
jgi:hypothetical protein